MEGSVEEKHRALKETVQNNFTVADFQWSLFVAALQSYKHDTVLRPFPPTFIKEDENGAYGNRDFKALERTVDEIPSLHDVLKTSFGTLENESTLDLLMWCLNRNTFSVQLCKPDVLQEIRKKTKQQTPTSDPSFIFEVIPSMESEDKFQEMCGERKMLYAFHGSHIENFHSILNSGLQGHMNKNSLFGEGTYLSSELAISLQYSPHGQGWEHSVIGDRLSCVAVCEMIDDPSVKYQTRDPKNGMKRIASRSKITGSEGGEVPDTYYVVQNNDMIRVKYLMLYAQRTKKRTQSWFYQHKYIVFLVLYAVLLLVIALYNSKAFWSTIRKLKHR